jgi:predicted metal-dependent peptidase
MDTLVASTKPKGGGGTDPVCVEKYLKKESVRPEAIIMLTDGYVGSWGTGWEAPILWVISNNPRATAAVGQTIHIKDN